jgi:hypothetical protein
VTAPASNGKPRGTRRWPILVVVLGLLGAGIAAGHATSAPAERVAAPTDAAQTAAANALTSEWFCPGLPASFPNRDQTLTLSNLGADATDAVVTIDPDDGTEPVQRTVSVPGNSVRSFDRATLAATSRTDTGAATGKGGPPPLPTGPLVVEPLSPSVVVQQGLENEQTLDLMTCATTTSTDWYFAAGTTVRGVSEWLMLDNPASTDARVDVAVRSEVGLRLLPELQGIDVPGRSRVVVEVHNQAVRQERVALAVHAVVGRVVASETMQFAQASGPPGVASTVGTLAPAKRWWFTDGRAVPDAVERVAVSNLGPIDTQVIAQALIGSAGIVAPVSISVPANGVSWVQIGNCEQNAKDCLRVPDNRDYDLIVSDAQVSVVAQTFSRFGGGTGSLGATTSTGSTVPGRRWVVARTRAVAGRSTSVSVMNPGPTDAHIDVEVVHAGRTERPPKLQDVTVTANDRVALPASALPDDDAALVVTSDQPVVVESTIYAARDATRSTGIPSR